MSKNKKNFITGLIGSGLIFAIGVLYILLPNYYGFDNLVSININNLFISFILIYATSNLAVFAFSSKDNISENVWLCVVACICGMANNVFSFLVNSELSMKLSLLMLTGLVTLVKVTTIRYYKQKNNGVYYMETILTLIFSIVGIIISLCLYDETLIQTFELGFYIIMISILNTVSTTFKCLIKAPRFLGKIKF